MTDLTTKLRTIVGDKGYLVGDDIGPRYSTDIMGVRKGRAGLVLRPKTTAEVARILALCHREGQPIAVQGGMTGLVSATVPMAGEIVLSLERMTAIEELDGASATMTVQSGVPLQVVQEHAEENGFMFALDLGARGSCTIGGNLSTNAGGNRVIRFGMARELVLGIEAVLADGTVLDGLHKLPKNNAGYDLKHLFIGSEGTLGVVTRATLRLTPKPQSQSVAFCAASDFDAVVRLLDFARRRIGATLSAFEVLWQDAYRLTVEQVEQINPPFDPTHAFYILIEALGADERRDAVAFADAMAAAMDEGLIADAVLAKSDSEVRSLWLIRDAVTEATAALRPMLVYDVSLPVGDMADFYDATKARLSAIAPEAKTILFGHMGDGNLHLIANLGPETHAMAEAADEAVYAVTGELQGSISAEHGIGFLKRPYLHHSRSESEIALMRQLKRTLDPKAILNPGRVVEIA